MRRKANRKQMTTPSLFRDIKPVTGPSCLGLQIGEDLHPLPDGRCGWLGSGARVTFTVPDPHVSRRHCVVESVGGKVNFTDHSSTNGLWLGGQRHQHVEVEAGSVVFLGRFPVLVVEMGFSVRYPNASRWQGMIVRSPRMRETLTELAQVANSQASILLTGESGSGKERAARAIHAVSTRAEKPMVTLNCAALPEALAEGELFGVTRGAYTGAHADREGAFHRAHHGSLFLDEIAEFPLSVQAKLLRAIEDGSVRPLGRGQTQNVDVRLIAATWQDLTRQSEEGRFRHDLLQRIGTFKMKLPPLRERPLDIGPILEATLVDLGTPNLWPTELQMEHVLKAPWHGNVRQLRAMAIHAAATGHFQVVGAGEPTASVSRLPRRGRVPEGTCRRMVKDAIARRRGNISEAARELKVSRATVYRWLQQ
jgi:DNA-binding NtrC family response regulator